MPTATTDNAPLIDRFGRPVTYLRISVTDRCDFRCLYCMNEETQFVRRAQILSLEEIFLIAEAFCQLGVHKIRITGGEPLVRQNLLWLLEALGGLPGLRELVLTTNGSQLARYAEGLRRAGVSRLNISLDSIRPERFRYLTRNGNLAQVLAGLDAAQQAGFERIKLNVVALKGYNEDEIPALVAFALDRGLDITFIEEMPVGQMDGRDRAAAFYSSDLVRRDIERHYTLLPSAANSGGPARYFQIPGHTSRIGLISPHTHNFCNTCNRVRLTAEGRLLPCLGQEQAVDLKHTLRTHPGDPAHLKKALRQAVAAKPAGHEFDRAPQTAVLRYMHHTGG
jgi:cyclic pyranopterin phosphate synthase